MPYCFVVIQFYVVLHSCLISKFIIIIMCCFASDVNECKLSPTVCGPRERCVDLVGSFRCQRCSDDEDDDDVGCGAAGACQSNPCRHGGTCQPRRDGGFRCRCRPGFTGRRCQRPADASPRPPVSVSCRPGQCLNGGRCEPTADGIARCVCLQPWLGRYCQVSLYSLFKAAFDFTESRSNFLVNPNLETVIY